MHISKDLEDLLQFDHQLPILFGEVGSEVVLAGINRFTADLRHEHVRMIEMASVQLWSVAGCVFNSNANLRT